MDTFKSNVLELFSDYDIVDEFLIRADNSMIVSLVDGMNKKQLSYLKEYITDFN